MTSRPNHQIIEQLDVILKAFGAVISKSSYDDLSILTEALSNSN